MMSECSPEVLVSVVIPACNRSASLAKTLDCIVHSLRDETRFGWEIIVSDDSSDPACRMMIKERYPLVTWVAGPRRGPASNRNNGANLSNGEWLFFTDDDCLPSTSWVDAFLRHMDGCNVLEGYTTAECPRYRLDLEAPINEKGGNLWSCNFAIRKELFFELGGFDEKFPHPAMEDIDLRIRLEAKGENIPFVRDAEVIHPWRLDPRLKTYLDRWRSWFYFIQKHPSERPRIVGFYLMKNAIRQMVRFIIPGLFQYRGRGFPVAFRNCVLLGLLGLFSLVKHDLIPRTIKNRPIQ